jgi:hypothetical protein
MAEGIVEFDGWLEQLQAVASEQPELVATDATIRYSLALEAGPTWVVHYTASARPPVIFEVEPAGGGTTACDCHIWYESAAIWAGMVRKDVSPMTAFRKGQVCQAHQFCERSRWAPLFQ